MTADICDKYFRDYQKKHTEFIGYYQTVLAVHQRFKPEFVDELERLHSVQEAAKLRWMESINETYLREIIPK